MSISINELTEFLKDFPEPVQNDLGTPFLRVVLFDGRLYPRGTSHQELPERAHEDELIITYDFTKNSWMIPLTSNSLVNK